MWDRLIGSDCIQNPSDSMPRESKRRLPPIQVDDPGGSTHEVAIHPANSPTAAQVNHVHAALTTDISTPATHHVGSTPEASAHPTRSSANASADQESTAAAGATFPPAAGGQECTVPASATSPPAAGDQECTAPPSTTSPPAESHPMKKKSRTSVFGEPKEKKVGRPSKGPNEISSSEWEWLFKKVAMWIKMKSDPNVSTKQSLDKFAESVRQRLRVEHHVVKNHIIQIEKRLKLKEKHPPKPPKVLASPWTIVARTRQQYISAVDAASKAKKQLQDAEKRVDSAAQEIAESKQKVEEAEARVIEVQELECERESLENQLAEARAEIERCKASISAEFDGGLTLDHVKQELAGREAELIEIINQTQEHEATINELQRRAGDQEAERMKLLEMIEDVSIAKKDLDAAKIQIDKLNQANEKLSQHLIPSMKKATLMQLQAQQSKKDFEDASAKVEAFKERLGVLESQLQTKEDEAADAKLGLLVIENGTQIDAELQLTDQAVRDVFQADVDPVLMRKAKSLFSGARRVTGDRIKVAMALCRASGYDRQYILHMSDTLNEWKNMRNVASHEHEAYKRFKDRARVFKGNADRVCEGMKRSVQRLKNSRSNSEAHVAFRTSILDCMM